MLAVQSVKSLSDLSASDLIAPSVKAEPIEITDVESDEFDVATTYIEIPFSSDPHLDTTSSTVNQDSRQIDKEVLFQVVDRLQLISDQLAASAVSIESYNQFEKYLVSLLRKIPEGKQNGIKLKLLGEIYLALDSNQENVNHQYSSVFHQFVPGNQNLSSPRTEQVNSTQSFQPWLSPSQPQLFPSHPKLPVRTPRQPKSTSDQPPQPKLTSSSPSQPKLRNNKPQYDRTPNQPLLEHTLNQLKLKITKSSPRQKFDILDHSNVIPQRLRAVPPKPKPKSRQRSQKVKTRLSSKPPKTCKREKVIERDENEDNTVVTTELTETQSKSPLKHKLSTKICKSEAKKSLEPDTKRMKLSLDQNSSIGLSGEINVSPILQNLLTSSNAEQSIPTSLDVEESIPTSFNAEQSIPTSSNVDQDFSTCDELESPIFQESISTSSNAVQDSSPCCTKTHKSEAKESLNSDTERMKVSLDQNSSIGSGDENECAFFQEFILPESIPTSSNARQDLLSCCENVSPIFQESIPASSNGTEEATPRVKRNVAEIQRFEFETTPSQSSKPAAVRTQFIQPVPFSPRRVRHKYSKSALLEALASVEGGMTIMAASNKFGIPRETLRKTVYRQGGHLNNGRPCLLSKQEEKQLMEWIVVMKKSGLRVTRKQIISSARALLNNLGKPFTTPGDWWVKGFIKRNPVLCEIISPSPRAISKCDMSEDDKSWFLEMLN